MQRIFYRSQKGKSQKGSKYNLNTGHSLTLTQGKKRKLTAHSWITQRSRVQAYIPHMQHMFLKCLAVLQRQNHQHVIHCLHVAHSVPTEWVIKCYTKPRWALRRKEHFESPEHNTEWMNTQQFTLDGSGSVSSRDQVPSSTEIPSCLNVALLAPV